MNGPLDGGTDDMAWKCLSDQRYPYLIHIDKVTPSLIFALNLKRVAVRDPAFATVQAIAGLADDTFEDLLEDIQTLRPKQIGEVLELKEDDLGDSLKAFLATLSDLTGFEGRELIQLLQYVIQALPPTFGNIEENWPEVLLPPHSVNPSPPPLPSIPWPHLEIGDVPPPCTPITAVIDDGINPFHDRFRGPGGGRTRILGHWEQQGVWDHDVGLPFGRWLPQQVINSGIYEIELKGLSDLDLAKRWGLFPDGPLERAPELWRSTTHGMHVADLAAGEDPTKTPEFERSLITVNMPTRQVISFAGSYLIFYVTHAIARIGQFVDALWERHYPNEPIENRWPVVIALPYGQSAGRRDGKDLVAKMLTAVNGGTTHGAKSLVMPSGNNNLERTHTAIEVGTSGTALPWRTLPRDQSMNFCEIWTDPLPSSPPESLRIGLKSPSGEVLVPLSAPSDGACARFEWVSETKEFYVTAERHEMETGEHRLQYLISLAPTERAAGIPAQQSAVSSAGVYEITLASQTGKVGVVADIQIDLAFTPDSDVSKASYFDPETYRKYEPKRNLYRDVGDPRQSEHSGLPPARQRGASNALVASTSIVSVGGYVEINGLPWSSSSIARGTETPGLLDREWPTLAMPVHGGPATVGNLAAGTRSGSTAVWLGTSSAVGLAARLAVDRMQGTSNTTEAVLKDVANSDEKELRRNRPHYPDVQRNPPKEKIGEGRALSPQVDRVARI